MAPHMGSTAAAAAAAAAAAPSDARRPPPAMPKAHDGTAAADAPSERAEPRDWDAVLPKSPPFIRGRPSTRISLGSSTYPKGIASKKCSTTSESTCRWRMARIRRNRRAQRCP
mmetsp:Transcript_93939/g.253101  ORF Transcript_93939/g.253101 Transcript_93939/m.253101 type:complete len:113 (+) Transcript_93939:359-697(+)